jgi:hypothetical protein
MNFSRTRRTAVFCLNNPSTADDKEDDPTVRRGWGFTEAWGMNRMVFVNTNCHRATRPRDRRPMPQLQEDWNSANLRHFALEASIIVCAWGDAADPKDAARAIRVLRSSGRPLHVLGPLTKSGNPRHILYLRSDLKPAEWSP